MAEKGLPEVKATNTQDNESSARQLPKNGTTTDEPQSSHSFRRGSNTANDRVDEAAAASANPPSTSGAPPVDSHYYKDLPEWLEVTGYHNIEYRQAKLARYQKIQQLAAEMEKIKQEVCITSAGIEDAATYVTSWGVKA